MLKVAIAGLGNVGCGTVRLLQQNAELISARAGATITITAVSARDKSKKRDCDLSAAAWVENPLQLASRSDIDAVVELIGGADGTALELAEQTLKQGKHLITANKALLAKHGVALSKLAESYQVQIFFEAAVAGGIPVIKSLREGLAANRITSVRGILNGTCNYILTRMYESALDFQTALKEAQDLGYAEADPTSDIDGHDTANKLVILAALAFGSEPDLKSIQLEGIRAITPLDLQFADELDCRIKLLGVARLTDGKLEQHVAPVLVSLNSPLSKVDGALNAVLMQGDFVGQVTLQGAGAGAGATASAVVADIIDLARGHKTPVFGIAASQLKNLPAGKSSTPARYYMRLQVMDKPGVVADISAILRDAGISIETLLQRAKSVTHSVPVVITTHEAKDDVIRRVVSQIANLPALVEKPCLYQIEE